MMVYQYFLYAFLKYVQNNLAYLIQNMIHPLIRIYHSILVLIFQIYCYCMSFLCFSMSPLLKSNLSVNLSIKTCGSEVLLFSEFTNIVSIVYM